ncbi:MAG: hypothetical protein K2L24_03535, partial [Opitutales bacterium]|nr:hypothetical protein [Opitutales bacterium]
YAYTHYSNISQVLNVKVLLKYATVCRIAQKALTKTEPKIQQRPWMIFVAYGMIWLPTNHTITTQYPPAPLGSMLATSA